MKKIHNAFDPTSFAHSKKKEKKKKIKEIVCKIGKRIIVSISQL